MSEREFGRLLSAGIHHISACENKQLQVIEDELGYAVNRNGGSAIHYWRHGHRPSKSTDVEILARHIVQRGRVDRAWLERFLHSANFPNLAGLCDELFPDRRYQTLPAPPTALIGREREVATLMERLRSNHIRLLTLTGAPGVGKTRLVLHLATALLRTFQHGVVFVPLASIRDPELVMTAIASTVGLRDIGGSALKTHLLSFLQERELLLVLDNFEQVIAAAPYVADVLSAAPRLKILVTSREPLHIYGEFENPVLPLALADPDQPMSPESLARVPAVQLYVERAQAVNPQFQLTAENGQAVSDICARLDGLPLALELVAARSKRLPPLQLLEQLNDRFALLVNGARDLPVRQQTLQAAIDWSYDLLTEAERQVLRRVSVFRGGCTGDAILNICNQGGPRADRLSDVVVLELLERLIDKGLVQSVQSGASREPRYLMLETIQEYASRKLTESGEAGVVQQRHRDWCLQLAEEAKPNLRGPHQLYWLNRLEQEINNFRKTLAWCVEHPTDVELGLRLTASLHWFWHLRSRQCEGADWLSQLLKVEVQSVGSHSIQQARAQAMRAASTLYGLQRNPAKAMELAQASLKLFHDIGDSPGVVAAKISLSYIACLKGDTAKGVALAEEVLPVCRVNGDRFSEAQLLDSVLGEAFFLEGDYIRATACHEKSLALRRAIRDMDGIAWSSFLLARNIYAAGDIARAQQLYEECLTLWRQLGNRLRSTDALHELGRLHFLQGNHLQAKSLFEESLVTAKSYGDSESTARALADLQMVAHKTEAHSIRPESAHLQAVPV